jgi:hypothetical protein
LEEQRQTIAKLKTEETKLAQYVNEFKTALKRKQEKEVTEASKRSLEEEEKIEKQLEKEVENAKTMLKNYQH